jgi:Fe-S-cluster containining protein
MPRRRPSVISDGIATVRAIYADVDARPVERACLRRTECCQFHVTGRTPHLTKGEALTAARALRATGRTRLPERDDGACPLLDDGGRCLIYADRPFGCRTHFCAAAGGPHERRTVSDLIQRLEDLDVQLGGEGSRPLVPALRAALCSERLSPPRRSRASSRRRES